MLINWFNLLIQSILFSLQEREEKVRLQAQIKRLWEDNQRLQEESQTSAAKLKKFTEWVFNTIDMNWPAHFQLARTHTHKYTQTGQRVGGDRHERLFVEPSEHLLLASNIATSPHRPSDDLLRMRLKKIGCLLSDYEGLTSTLQRDHERFSESIFRSSCWANICFRKNCQQRGSSYWREASFASSPAFRLFKDNFP